MELLPPHYAASQKDAVWGQLFEFWASEKKTPGAPVIFAKYQKMAKVKTFAERSNKH